MDKNTIKKIEKEWYKIFPHSKIEITEEEFLFAKGFLATITILLNGKIEKHRRFFPIDVIDLWVRQELPIYYWLGEMKEYIEKITKEKEVMF